MTESKKTILNIALSITTLLAVVFFWRSPVLLSVLLVIVASLMFLIERDRTALYIYFVGFLFGPLSESLAIYFGTWTYTNPHILGFSVWLPFLWGNAVLFINRLSIFLHFYAERSRKSSP